MDTKKPKAITVQIKSMRADHQSMVEDIEMENDPFPWSWRDFEKMTKENFIIDKVVVYKGRVIGFMIYLLSHDSIHILKFAVKSEFKDHDVMQSMMLFIAGRICDSRRTYISFGVRESNLPRQLFLRDCEFQVTNVRKGAFESDPKHSFYDLPEDAYYFVHSSPKIWFKKLEDR